MVSLAQDMLDFPSQKRAAATTGPATSPEHALACIYTDLSPIHRRLFLAVLSAR